MGTEPFEGWLSRSFEHAHKHVITFSIAEGDPLPPGAREVSRVGKWINLEMEVELVEPGTEPQR